MIRNYLVTAWRNMLCNKLSSFINIAGLGIGIASTLFILVFIQNEFQYDKFHKDAGRIYQVVLNGNMNGQEFWAGNTPPPVGEALFSNIPEIETYTRFYKPGDLVVRYEGGNTPQFFTEKKILAADSNFLQVFEFPALRGDVRSALMKPGSVVITADMAKKYFGHEEALGKSVLIGQDKKPFTVTAVLENIPSQSSIQFDFLTPVADYPVVKRFSWSWVWQQMVCYVKLKPGVTNDKASLNAIESKFPAVVKVQAANGFRRIGKPFDEFIKAGGKWDFHLLPLADVHLYSASIGMPWLYNLSNIKYTYIFASIALFIILLACVNFMNLSTARAAGRAKEVGIRKVSGSTNSQLIRQFLAEAFLYSFLAAIVAVALVLLLFKSFSVLVGEPIPMQTALTTGIWLALGALMIAVGLLAGSYPAFYLSTLKPIAVLKSNSFTSGRKTSWLRNGLVIFQFTISTVMIVGTLVVLKQLRYFRNVDMGFDKENVLVISGTNRLGKSEESFRQSLLQVQGVHNASITTGIPSGSAFGDSYQPEPESAHTSQEVNLNSFMTDETFVPTLQLKVLQGRNFSLDYRDSASVILNEAAVKEIGWKEPVGKWLDYPGGNGTRFKVIGVVKDFNVQSLQSPMISFALFHSSSKSYGTGMSYILVKTRSNDLRGMIGKLESHWKKFIPGEPFDYSFLQSEFDAQYKAEDRLGRVFSLFSALSVFIACMGLFGLCVYMLQKRTKEIGIRKVLGASLASVVALVSKDFLKLALVAIVVAFPIGWWAMNKWLEDFAYRVEIGWLVFFVAGAFTMFVTLITVIFQSVKAAGSNPVKSLRTE